MKQIVVDDQTLAVIQNDHYGLKVSRGEIETLIILSDVLKPSFIERKVFGRTDQTVVKALTIMSRDQSIILEPKDQNFTQALLWLQGEHWQVHEAMGRSLLSPGVRTHVIKASALKA